MLFFIYTTFYKNLFVLNVYPILIGHSLAFSSYILVLVIENKIFCFSLPDKEQKRTIYSLTVQRSFMSWSTQLM